MKVSSDIDDLQSLHKQTGWTPGKQNIRPSDREIREKEEFNSQILKDYMSITDYILNQIFAFTPSLNSERKLVCKIETPDKYSFCENTFPYCLPEKTEHYIMWYLEKPRDDIINSQINQEIKKIVKAKFEYIWYENPKNDNT